MAQLFANHFRVKTPSTPIEGQYDPEQELWVGDNQLEGASPLLTQTSRGTTTTKGTNTPPKATLTLNGMFLDTDVQGDLDTGTDTDTFNDPDV